MSSYTDRFSSNLVSVAPASFANIPVSADVTLSWPIEFQDVNLIAANTTFISPTANGFEVTLPSARFVSDGQAILIYNPTGHTFDLLLNDATLLVNNFPANTGYYIVLTNNTTAAGTWTVFPFSAGSPSVSSVAAVTGGPGADNMSITGSPITNNGTFTFIFEKDLAAVTELNTATGYLTRSGTHNAPLWVARTLTGTANQINITNPTGAAGNSVFSLDPDVRFLTSLTAGSITLSGTTVGSAADLTLSSGTSTIKLTGDTYLIAKPLIFSNADLSHDLSITAPYPLAADASYTLPPLLPTSNNQFLTCATTGHMTWQTGSIGSFVGNNRILNGDFQIWQRGAGGNATFSFTSATAASATYAADRWQCLVGGAALTITVSQHTEATAGNYYSRVQRNAGSTGLSNYFYSTSLPISRCTGLAGQYITVSFWARIGNNYSGNFVTFSMVTGTGNVDVSEATTGYVGPVTLQTNNIVLTNNWTFYTITSANPAANNVTQVAFVITAAGTGTAGTNDYYDIALVQLEAGQIASAFDQISFEEELELCQYRYQKTFFYQTAPAQAVGANSGEYNWPALLAGATSQSSPMSGWMRQMSGTPTIVTYNPVAANAFVRNETLNTDSSVTTVAATPRGFTVTATPSGGTTFGNTLAVHVTADSELY